MVCMNTILNSIKYHIYIDEGVSMQNIMVIVVEFGWMSEIIIFGVSYVKDIDFWGEILRTSKIVIFCIQWCQRWLFLMCSEAEQQK